MSLIKSITTRLSSSFIISGTRKATNFKFGRYIHRSMRTKARSWDNRGYLKNWAVPGYAHAPFSQNFKGLLFGWTMRGPLKISQLVEYDQCLLMRTSLGWVCPQQFLTPEIQKLAKNLVYFSKLKYFMISWGNCTQTFLYDVSTCAILRLYCRYLQIGTR